VIATIASYPTIGSAALFRSITQSSWQAWVWYAWSPVSELCARPAQAYVAHAALGSRLMECVEPLQVVSAANAMAFSAMSMR
jgi:uncharacterized protein (DUF1810 family)